MGRPSGRFKTETGPTALLFRGNVRLPAFYQPNQLNEEPYMTSSRALLATVLLTMVAQTQVLRAEPRSPTAGSYEITARLEVPHLERWGVDKTTIICLPDSLSPGNIPIPVVSANNPFAKCSAANLLAEGS